MLHSVKKAEASDAFRRATILEAADEVEWSQMGIPLALDLSRGLKTG